MLRSTSKPNSNEALIGFAVSVALHLVSLVGLILWAETSEASSQGVGQVFTVTIEGGERLGGIGQVPLDEKPKPKNLPNQLQPTATKPVSKPEQESSQRSAEEAKAEKLLATEREAEIERLTAIEEVKRKALDEKRLAEERAEQKRREAKEIEQKKILEKAKLEATKLEQAKKEREREKKEKAEREKKFSELIKSNANRYTGESVDVGGQGFGAAKLGGKGMGGGVLASRETVAYLNALIRHLKQGWSWFDPSKKLAAVILVHIDREGHVRDARIVGSSGNQSFDDSVIRAVQKATPVPAPPQAVFEQSQGQLRINFTSED